jgi:hypothetical protein
MADIEPFKVNSGGANAVVSGIGQIATSIGNAASSAGQSAGVRASVRMHRDQLLHEATQSQLAHERNLKMLKEVSKISSTTDRRQQLLKERNREHVLKTATTFVTDPGSAVRGGSRVDLQETAEGGHRVSYTARAQPRVKPPKVDKPAAVSTPATTPATPRVRKPAAPKATTPKVPTTKARATAGGAQKAAAKSRIAPDDMYND